MAPISTMPIQRTEYTYLINKPCAKVGYPRSPAALRIFMTRLF